MLTVIKGVLGLAGLVVVAAIIIYFLPANLKTKTLTFVSGIVPDALQAKAKELLMTPPEQRAELIEKISDNVAALKNAGGTQADALAQETEQLLADLKTKNGERSLTEILKEKLIDQLLKKSPPECPLPATP